MKLRRFLLYPLALLALLAGNQSASALSVEGVEIPEQVTLAGQYVLPLNGAGMRTKFFMDIYVGALYLPAKNSDAGAISAADAPARIAMYFRYKELSRERQVEAWEKGFKKNLAEGQWPSMQARVEQAKTYFRGVSRGGHMFFDYIPGVGTRFIVNDEVLGTVEGHDFFQAVLGIWLGAHPPQQALKEAMLGLE